MARPSVERTEVAARFDPFDLSVVFAAIDGKWVECGVQHLPELRNVTERTRRVASLVHRTLRRTHAARREKTHGAWLGKFGEETREDERVQKEMRRANAQKHALGKSTAPISVSKVQLPKINFSQLKKGV